MVDEYAVGKKIKVMQVGDQVNCQQGYGREGKEPMVL